MTGYRVAERVGVVERDDIVYVATLPEGPALVLEGTAALIWRTACTGSAETLVRRVARASGQPSADIAESVLGFVDELVARGCLIRD